jgi:hypothetical protein
MKNRLCLACLFLSFSLHAADLYPTLTTLDGETITNAEITSHTAMYAIVVWEGGGKKIYFTNLPPAIQQKYHFDPAAGEAAAAAQAQHQAAIANQSSATLAQIAEAQANRGPVQKIHILKVISDTYVQFTGTNGILASGYIHNIPPEVIGFVRDLNKTTADAAAMRGVNAAATYTKTVGAGKNAHEVPTKTLTDEAVNALATRRHLEELLHREHVGASFIMAAPTAYMLNGTLRQWEFMGQNAALLAPDLSTPIRTRR